MTHDDGLEALLAEHEAIGRDSIGAYCECGQRLGVASITLPSSWVRHVAAVVRAAG